MRKINKRHTWEEEKAVSASWLITFTDIMALMLTFFVLLYSMASPQEDQWDEMSASLNREFNQFYAPEFQEGPQDTIEIDRIDWRNALNLGYLANIIEQSLEDSENAEGILVFEHQDRLLISMPYDLLFEKGSSDILSDGQRVLFKIGGILSRIKNKIEVVGHADPDPISEASQNFNSNWDLSLIRAISVSGTLENVGYTRPILVRGMSSARFDDLSDDIDLEERYNLSRRVDIVVLKEDRRRRSVFRGFE